MKKIFLFAYLLFISNCFSQAPTIQWQKSFGGTQQDLPYKIQQTNDGGYITAGYTLSTDGNITINNGDADFWIVKTNSNGVLEWQKTYGGTNYEYAFDIQQTSDNGYIVAGYTASNNGDITLNRGITDYWIIKLNSSGTIQWQKTYGGSGIDYAYSIRQTSDGGYILLGETTSNDGNVSLNHGGFDIWVLKLNSTGSIEWSKTYGGSNGDYASMIDLTTDGGFIIAGNTHSNNGDVTGYHNEKDYWVIKINSTGIIQWQKAIGGSQWDFLKEIEQTSDGGYIAVGKSTSNDGDHISILYSQGWVVKLSSLGVIQWEKAIGSYTVLDLVSVKEKSPGEYIVAGVINSDIYNYPTSQNYWITKINNSGTIIWENLFGGSNIDVATSLILTSDNGYAISGYSNSINGDIINGHDIYDFWIVKLSSEQLSSDTFDNKKILLYPNPTTDLINLDFPNGVVIDRVIITDLTGKIIISQTENVTQIDTQDLANGIYIIQALSSDMKYQSKFLKQ